MYAEQPFTHICTAPDINNVAFHSLFFLIINLPKHPHLPDVYFSSPPYTGSGKATERQWESLHRGRGGKKGYRV